MRRLAVLLLALAVSATVQLAVPRITVACSCVAPEDIITMAAEDPATIAFTGEAGPAVGDALPVSVTGWFPGPATPMDVVIVQVEGGESSMCGMSAPPAGREYLFMPYTAESGRLALNLCSVVADLGTPEGQAVLAKAVATLGAPQAVASAPPSAEPTTPPTDDPTATVMALLPVVLVGLFAVGLVAGFVGIWRRRTPGER
jgi:hypothetical protein